MKHLLTNLRKDYLSLSFLNSKGNFIQMLSSKSMRAHNVSLLSRGRVLGHVRMIEVAFDSYFIQFKKDLGVMMLFIQWANRINSYCLNSQ